MSLPAGPMISLTAALDGICTIWQADGGERKVAVADFVTGNQRNVLAPGDLLRQIDIPLDRAEAARRLPPDLADAGRPLSGAADRHASRSVGEFLLTVTASTRRPVRLSFAKMPSADELREAILWRITDDRYHDDVHGKPEWRKHMTLRLAEEVRSELADAGEPMSSP